MMPRIPAAFFVLLFLLAAVGSRAQPGKPRKQGSIYIEHFAEKNPNDSTERYNTDNTVFTVGKTFTYAFTHVTADGQTLYFCDNPGEKPYDKAWHFATGDSACRLDRVKICVTPGLKPFFAMMPGYSQTVLEYTYYSSSGKAAFASSSGVIENSKNVWMHPPRDKYFRILELNPFPFIRFPYREGATWKWKLDVGASWSDVRWKTWDGMLHIRYRYHMGETETIPIPGGGEAECRIVRAEAVSRIGKTTLVLHYHPVYGFVRMHYVNIDGSRTFLDLITVE